MTNHCVYLSLGSNLGNRKAIITRAIAEIERLIGAIERQSAFLETEPWGYSSPNRFLNACVRCRTTLSPRQLLCATQTIERNLGRTQKSTDHQYHDRTIDIDILTYDNLNIDEPDLHIPHPRMHERDFVMIPLRQIMD